MVFQLLFLAIFSWSAPKGPSKYNVTCDNPSDCPSWVVGLSFESEDKSPGVCSGSLVAQDIVVTNLHCIPDDLRWRGKDCLHRIQLQFPKTTLEEAETLECDKVLDVSPALPGGTYLRQDYAFIKLAKASSRKPVVFSQDGFPDMGLVTIYKIDPEISPEGMSGVVRKIQCKSIQNSLMNPYFKTPASPLVMLSPCPIIKGNSGSGLIASDGTIRGVVSLYEEVLLGKEIKARLKTEAEKLQSASGTNFSCVPSPLRTIPPEPPGDQCRVELSEAKEKEMVDSLLKKEIEKALNEINLKVNEQMKSIRIGGSQLVFWKAQRALIDPAERENGVVAKAEVRPFCLLPNLGSLSGYEKRLKNQPVAIAMKISEFLVREKFDTYYRYQAVVEEKPFQMKLFLTPRDLLKMKQIDVQLTIEDSKTKSEEKFKLDLCQTLVKSQTARSNSEGAVKPPTQKPMAIPQPAARN